MAVNTGNRNQKQNNDPRETLADAQEQTRGQNAGQRPQSIGDVLGVFGGTPMSQHATGESTNKFEEAINAALSSELTVEDRKAYQVFKLDAEVHHRALSSLVVTKRVGDRVGAYVLVIEASGPKIPDHQFNLGGRTAQVDGVAGDVYDNTYWATVQSLLRTQLGGKVEIFEVGGYVIPKEVSPDDKDRVFNAAYVATTALYNVMGIIAQEDIPVISAGLLSTGETVSVRTEFNGGDQENAVGQVIRADVSVNAQAVLNKDTSVSARQILPLTNAGGYLDLVFTPDPSQAGLSNPYAVQQQGTAYNSRTYTPRFVVTNLRSAMRVQSMEMQLLTLATVTLMSKDNAWINMLRPNLANAGKMDRRDIGAIGFEVNYSGKHDHQFAMIDTKSEAFDEAAFANMVAASINPNLIYSLDVEEAGEGTWLQEMFVVAGDSRDPQAQNAAQRAIISHADKLTNGEFSRIYQGGNPVVGEVTRIHNGYYLDETGSPRDIRDLDYLAMLNQYGNVDMTIPATWSDTFDKLSEPEELRLETRANILRRSLGDTVRITGFSRRVNLNPEFLVGLAQAIAQAGLVLTPENIFSNTGIAQRGNMAAIQYGMSGQNVGGLFSYGNQGGYGNQFHHMGPRATGAGYQY